MTTLYNLEQIKAVMGDLDLSGPIARGFVAYSQGKSIVPPVGELIFTDPPGDTHIKYGYIRGMDYYVIKIASGFYENPKLGLPSSSGMMMVFCRKTGRPEAILHDEGYLTDVRTAVAGRICAACLAPETISGIGVLGTGVQARMQVEYLSAVIPCKTLYVWGRTPEKLNAYAADMTSRGYDVHSMPDPGAVAEKSNFLITTTPSETPLLFKEDIRPGTHITAMGSDTPPKQELDSKIFETARIIAADSIAQCRTRGEISKALAAGIIGEKDILELGRIIETPELVNRKDGDISIADLTGVAVQDIQIARSVYQAMGKKKNKRRF